MRRRFFLTRFSAPKAASRFCTATSSQRARRDIVQFCREAHSWSEKQVKWETSLLMGTYPELVDLSRCERNTEWFAKSAKDASCEIGKHMVKYTLEWLREMII